MSMSEEMHPDGGDVFAILTQGHRRISSLFEQIGGTNTAQAEQRTDLLQHLKHAFLEHALAEEDIVYPALEQYTRLRDNAQELFSEHAAVKTYLYELEQMPKDDPAWIEKANAFRNAVAEHILDEERNVFPLYRSMLDDEQINHLTDLVRHEQSLLRS